MNRLILLLALAAAVPASAQGFPDLFGGFVIQGIATRGFPGDSLTVSIDAANSGTAPAPAFEAAVYFSTDLFVSDDDTFLIRVPVAGIGVQQNGGTQVRVAVPDLPRGGYRLLVALDDPDTIREISETNNVNSVRFTVSPVEDGPDLLVSTADLEDETVVAGGRISIEYDVVNAGRADVGDFEAAFYLALINRPPSEWVLLERETIGGLDAGETQDESEQVTIPSNTPPGEYGIIVILDDQNLIAERIETNNTFGAGRIVVTAPTGSEAAPDAAAFVLRASPNPAGASVEVAYTLAEAGPVRLDVFDALGRLVAVVADGERGAGAHAHALNTSALPPGVYAARLTSSGIAASTLITVTR